jgi:predicted DNA-binding antitoxin AbrB/MazE fold protein
MLSVKGKFEKGVAQPLEPVEGREGQVVIITFIEDEVSELSAEETEFAWDALEQLIAESAVETGIADLAHQHDHYLYGKTKKE